MKRRLFWIPLALLWLLPVAASAAGFYLHPTLGAALPANDRGKVAVSAGAALGYGVSQYLAAEVQYNYLYHSDYRGHLMRGGPVLSLPLGILTPYATAGGGFHRLTVNDSAQAFHPLAYVGGGLNLNIFGPLSLGAGVNYDFLKGYSDFLNPYLTLSFIL